ncbi:cofilin family protein [Streptomyces sp. NPDC004244]|uniref:cofilin family protein n=1 Tax=Streptomyces sp. NPDC101206 TaxID=3366128 RepID=UPI003823CE68
MSSPVGFSEGSLDAFQHMQDRREINTVILRYAAASDVLVAEVEGNLTHEELLGALPANEPRLVVYELSFASPDGARKNEKMLIFWDPPGALGRKQPYADGYAALLQLLDTAHVHLKATQTAQLEHARLVTLAG